MIGGTGSVVGRTISHYRVRECIGSGGMGVVYEAEDLELGRRVAVKFLSAALAVDPQAVERFRREARAASALNHPHICTIHDIGTHDGQPFIVMERLQGRTLKQLETRPLSNEALVRAAIEIADALAAAHAAGFIHRDIKPANVFLTARGEVKLLDFGLAKLVRPDRGAPEAGGANAATVSAPPTTQHGSVVGTVGYMSPEQMRGEELDGRSDLFSFGALLYELATGREPFTGRTDVLVADAILHVEPLPPSALNPALHPDLDRIIRRALEKDRTLRYQTAADMRADLERLKRDSSGGRAGVVAADEAPPHAAAAGSSGERAGSGGTASPAAPRRAHRLWRATGMGAAVLVVIVAAGAVMFNRFGGRRPPLTDRDAIVMAEFENTTGEAVFDHTLKRALMVQFEQSPFFAIVSGDRVMTTLRLMARKPEEPLTRSLAREVCQRVGARAMLAGSIATLGARYVITLEGIGCATGDVLATAQTEAQGKDEVLRALGESGTTIRGRLGETLPSIQKYDVPVREVATGSLEALKLFSSAMLERDAGRDAAAVPLLERAIELDPEFALAWAHLSAVLPMAGRRDEANEALSHAFARRDRVPEQERYYISYRYYVGLGEVRKAIEVSETWAGVYPRTWTPHDNLCKLNWQLWNTERALAECREAIRLDPGSIYPYQGLIEFSMALGKMNEARSAAAGLLATHLNDARAHGYLARIAWVQEDDKEWQRESGWLRDKAAREYAQLEFERRLAEGRLRDAAKGRPVDLLTMALVGRVKEARDGAEHVLRGWQAKGSRGSVPAIPMFTVAMSGDDSWLKAAEESARSTPNSVVLNDVAKPLARALVELARGNGRRAVELLEPARAYGFSTMSFAPTYVRGLAFLQARQGREAAAEFEAITAHRGVDPGDVMWPLAHLGLARARALAGDLAGSRAAYERFFTIWSAADDDLPVLQEAKREYAQLGAVQPNR